MKLIQLFESEEKSISNMHRFFLRGLNQTQILVFYKIKCNKIIITGNHVLFNLRHPPPQKSVILSCLHGKIIM